MEVLRGAPATGEMAVRAAETELAAAQPLRGNAFKVKLAQGALATVVRELTGEARS